MRKYTDRVANSESFDKANSDCGSAVIWIFALMFVGLIARMGGML